MAAVRMKIIPQMILTIKIAAPDDEFKKHDGLDNDTILVVKNSYASPD